MGAYIFLFNVRGACQAPPGTHSKSKHPGPNRVKQVTDIFIFSYKCLYACATQTVLQHTKKIIIYLQYITIDYNTIHSYLKDRRNRISQ